MEFVEMHGGCQEWCEEERGREARPGRRQEQAVHLVGKSTCYLATGSHEGFRRKVKGSSLGFKAGSALVCRIGGGVKLEPEATQDTAAQTRDADLTSCEDGWKILGARR